MPSTARPRHSINATSLPELQRPNSAFIKVVAIDSAGRLWMSIALADQGWKAGTTRPVATGSGGVGPEDARRLLDWIYELVDPVTGTILVSTRFDEQWSFMPGARLAYTSRVDGDGIPYLLISSIRVSK